MPLLDPEQFRHHVDKFNATEPGPAEDIINLIPNAQSWEWMKKNIPFFTCPDAAMEEIYFFRWWCFRKHIKQTPAGIILTEFITPVRHAGLYDSISCALGHHIAEGRWIADQTILDQYVNFWFHADNGKPETKFHSYSSWVAAALYDRNLVTARREKLIAMLDDLVADYAAWENERLRPDGLFWQFDVRDGMEESISGSRTDRNARPTINSYMFGNAQAISKIAAWANRPDLSAQFQSKAAALKKLVQDKLWDSDARFFKAQTAANGLCESREEIGFIPWCFCLPDPEHEEAWVQLIDPDGFWAPFGLTTAERRAPKFRSHGVGNCEWDGAVWPFATSQTLNALSNVLRRYRQPHVTRRDYFHAMQTYVKSQHYQAAPYNGAAYVGEYLDEKTGAWLKGNNPRSRFYNHSTFADLVITGLAGLVPREDETVELDPFVPQGVWDWFCLDKIPYHGKNLGILWDRDGKRFRRGSGFTLFLDDQPVAHSDSLGPIKSSNH